MKRNRTDFVHFDRGWCVVWHIKYIENWVDCLFVQRLIAWKIDLTHSHTYTHTHSEHAARRFSINFLCVLAVFFLQWSFSRVLKLLLNLLLMYSILVLFRPICYCHICRGASGGPVLMLLLILFFFSLLFCAHDLTCYSRTIFYILSLVLISLHVFFSSV